MQHRLPDDMRNAKFPDTAKLMPDQSGNYMFGWGTTAEPAAAASFAVGALYIDLTNNKLKINTNTVASPTWTVVGAQTT